MSSELFTTEMKKATRKLHAMSDALVNAKLVFALNNNSVWADGLLIFYDIFRFLENSMVMHKDKNLGELHVEGMVRTEAFEKDLSYYLGLDWKNYEIRDSVAEYLSHLRYLSDNDPDLLMAYVYHLYMGLLSGGQILRKKMDIQRKLFSSNNDPSGRAVTDFGDHKIADLKKKLREKMNNIAENLSEEKKLLLIDESKKVFEYNNSIIKSVKGTNQVLLYNLLIVSVSVVFMFLILKIFVF